MSSETEARLPLPTKAEIYRTSGAIAPIIAGLALCVSSILRPALGAVAFYAALPLAMGLIVFFIALIARLRLVGFLPTNADKLVPVAIRNKLVSWALFRLGILGGVLLLIAAAIVAGLSSFEIQPFVDAIVYVVLLQVFGNLLVGTIVNVGIIVGSGNAHLD